eukprot:scaffold275428_cov27-Tisochrysis_lutea.AAC.2
MHTWNRSVNCATNRTITTWSKSGSPGGTSASHSGRPDSNSRRLAGGETRRSLSSCTKCTCPRFPPTICPATTTRYPSFAMAAAVCAETVAPSRNPRWDLGSHAASLCRPKKKRMHSGRPPADVPRRDSPARRVGDGGGGGGGNTLGEVGPLPGVGRKNDGLDTCTGSGGEIGVGGNHVGSGGDEPRGKWCSEAAARSATCSGVALSAEACKSCAAAAPVSVLADGEPTDADVGSTRLRVRAELGGCRDTSRVSSVEERSWHSTRRLQSSAGIFASCMSPYIFVTS